MSESPDHEHGHAVRMLMVLTDEVLAFSMRSPHLGNIERERKHVRLVERFTELAGRISAGLPPSDEPSLS